MAGSKKPTKLNGKENTKQVNDGFRRGYWLHFFLTLLAVYSLYTVVVMTVNTGYLPISTNIVSLMFPGASSLLIVIFSALFLFFALRKTSIPVIGKISAYLLVYLAAIALVATFIVSNNSSTMSSGLDFAFFVLFHNPYVSLFNSVVSIIGSIALAVTLIRRNK